MPPIRTKDVKKNYKNLVQPIDWRMHDLYSPGVGFNRIVTRSQTAFSRIKNSDSDINLFSDSNRQQLLGQPNVVAILKGRYGGIPRTTITRSTAQHLLVSEELDVYKEKTPPAAK
ncbi:hypothetical protein AVEN_85017-1 [Araneus ventricosus]|uniref:Uncharacterized protein n=1 Tax=Araneus ventricosus TaxID=182803 RepID=A0A4Y2W0T1_ARAVE|nr:hypothetical protein AVEN_194362-1 [Araneus ventricosus]GBO30436.1 hypothetical protein AVEN_188773-1 [Araneus ventricosus]GBO30481.1 hypothetical protein AVEN_134190-1 [Araneus ventricosus]GBO30510.1 hypothetical protein AVEN_85017-1 [Araneus ventricosus]